jgi:hypothetical protein
MACADFVAHRDANTWWPVLRTFLHGSYAARFGAGRGLVLDDAVGGGDAAGQCFNVSATLPANANDVTNASFSCGDWSGCGGGLGGTSWDFETCTLLVEAIGTNGVSDMFPPRKWSLEWLAQHCNERFGVTPRPLELVSSWGFDAPGLRAQGASKILFTNGLNDGWSAGGFVTDVDASKDLLVLNMPNGAHHSDLTHATLPLAGDTPDVLAARANATLILQRWIAEAKR